MGTAAPRVRPGDRHAGAPRRAARPDPEARRAALRALSGSICHQGTRWPASAYARTPPAAAEAAGHSPAAAEAQAAGHSPAATGALARLAELLASEREATAVTAAVALAYHAGPDLPDAALTALVEAPERDSLPDVAGWDRALRGFVAIALGRSA